jgi:predicted Zn-ribbon and HTH transcriptional regulator
MKNVKLKPYMGYSHAGGSQEGAVLIFAYNIKEAKRLAWPALHGLFVDDFIDMAVKVIKGGDYLFKQMPKWSTEKLTAGLPHVVDNPPICKNCEFWGVGEFNEEGYCPDCAEEIEAYPKYMSEHPGLSMQSQGRQGVVC